jgi:hypothetical protein
LTNEKDPADIILHEGEAKWKQMIESSEPANNFYFALALKNRNIDLIEDKKKIIADLLPVCKKISNTGEQALWLNKLSATIRVEEADLRQEMEKVKEDANAYEPKTINPACSNPIVRTKQDLLEEQAIFFVLLDRSNASLLSLETVNNFSSPSREILLKIIENPEITNDELINTLKDSQPAVDLLNYLILKAEVESEIDDLKLELEKCVAERHNLINKNNRRELSLKIKECEAKGDFETLQKLLEEFNSLTIINKKNNENQIQEKESAPVEESQAKEPAQNQEEQKASSKELAEEIKEEQTSSESQG